MPRKVALSVAHHSAAQGAQWNGLTEYIESQKWVDMVMLCLYDYEVEVYEVPHGKLGNKVHYINDQDCDLAVEIHFNACGNCGAHGAETLYYPHSEKGAKAAQCVQDAMIAVPGVKDRGIKEGWYKMDRPGVKDYHGDVDGDEKIDYFLRATNCTALILEPEFIESLAAAPYDHSEMCHNIAQGIMVYLDGLN